MAVENLAIGGELKSVCLEQRPCNTPVIGTGGIDMAYLNFCNPLLGNVEQVHEQSSDGIFTGCNEHAFAGLDGIFVDGFTPVRDCPIHAILETLCAR